MRSGGRTSDELRRMTIPTSCCPNPNKTKWKKVKKVLDKKLMSVLQSPMVSAQALWRYSGQCILRGAVQRASPPLPTSCIGMRETSKFHLKGGMIENNQYRPSVNMRGGLPGDHRSRSRTKATPCSNLFWHNSGNGHGYSGRTRRLRLPRLTHSAASHQDKDKETLDKEQQNCLDTRDS